MPETLEQAIVQASVSVLETSAFLSVWPYSEEDGDLNKPDIAATMGFHGPSDGQLTLRVSSELLPTIAENMLGEFGEGDSVMEKGGDALKELLNIICGNFLTIWFGEDPVFNLNPPQILEKMPETCKHEAMVRFTLENTIAEVDICLSKLNKSTSSSASSAVGR